MEPFVQRNQPVLPNPSSLPSRATPASRSGPANPASPSSGRVRVLWVQGRSSSSRLRAPETLAGLGEPFDVEIVEGCHEALVALCEPHPLRVGLVVLEGALSPPEIEFLERLRGGDPPVIFVSSGSGEDLAVEAFRRGAADCVLGGPDLARAVAEAAARQLRRPFRSAEETEERQQQVLQTEKMASIGQLAAGVAHEINNPMGFIHANLSQMTEYLGDLRRFVSSVETLLEGGELVSPSLFELSNELELDFVMEDFAKAIRECQEGAERVRHIVQDLREFSHPDEGQLVLADVNQCVDSTASIVWTMMKHTATLERDYGELPQILCYPMQLKQVFMNLLVNAYQAIEERLRDSGGRGEIRIATRVVGEGVEISVRDTGVGIGSEDLDRIFDPFFTTKKVGEGTGLGLSTSYGIIRRHGGRVRADSKLGEGSLFEVWLPIAGPAEDG